MEEMQIVYINSDYTDYLREVDSRVSWNHDKNYKRAYVGVILNVNNEHKYFVPLTSGGKNKKFQTKPLFESNTFLPIDNCEHGGMNFNNMIPIVDGVATKINMILSRKDNDYQIKYKNLLHNQWLFINRNENRIIEKAKRLYDKKINNKLSPRVDSITCDFIKLEEHAKTYVKPKKKKW
jgi:protein AbiQ